MHGEQLPYHFLHCPTTERSSLRSATHQFSRNLPNRQVGAVDESGSANAPRGTSAPLPTTFGRYTIIKRLGQGGMGSVYLARDLQLERPVALKVPDFGPHEGPETRQRFLEEVRTAAMLDHPYLCPMYDAEETEGRPYLTMAYIEGQSLDALIGRSLPRPTGATSTPPWRPSVSRRWPSRLGTATPRWASWPCDR